MLAIRDYEQAPYLVLATRNGLVKKTRLGDYNSPRQAGVIAINFREDDDELIGAELVEPDDDILLVSRKGQAIRFRADDSQLRPMGRATSGVTGMKFRDGDSVLSMSVIRADQVEAEAHDAVKPQYVFTMTDGGFAKRTRITDYRQQSAAASASRRCRWPTRTAAAWSAPSSWSRATRSCRSPRAVRSCAARSTPTSGRPVARRMGVKFVTPKDGRRGGGGRPLRRVAGGGAGRGDGHDHPAGETGSEVSTGESDESPDVAYGCNNRERDGIS